MPGPGVTLHLTLPSTTGPAEAATLLDRRLSAWVDDLGRADRPARLLVDALPTLPAELADGLRRLCGDAGVELAEAPGEGDVVVVADGADLPGPHLLARLTAAVTTDDVVHARTFPVDLPPTAGAGTCLAMPVSRWDALGRPSTASVLADLERTGVRPVLRPEATLWHDVRVDATGTLLPRTPRATHVPAWVPPGPPSGHPAALPSSTLAHVAAAAGLAAPEPDRSERPFLSVVTRTQGRRLQCLAEALTCLAAQTCRDVEIVLVCHLVAEDAMAGITAVVEAQPAWLRERVRVVRSERPGRAAPLNDGFLAAGGRYVVALDDDDTVLAHWVETFRSTEQAAAGTVLRAGALRQDVVPLQVETPQGEVMCPSAEGAAFPDWPLDFSLVDHLRANFSPFMTVAFPRGVVHELGLRFDESLDTTEDWHFLVRAAAVVGVTDAHELTSVYRWWTSEGSRALHDEAEWERGHDAVRRSFDEQVILLPPGSSHRFVDMHRERDEAWDEVRAMSTRQQEVIDELQEVVAAHDSAVASRDAYQARVAELEARVDELRERNEQRLEQQQERLDLMREAHALLASRRAEVPGGRSLFDLNRKELRGLIGRLSSATAPGRRRLFGQR